MIVVNRMSYVACRVKSTTTMTRSAEATRRPRFAEPLEYQTLPAGAPPLLARG